MEGHLELSINPSGMVCDYKCFSSTCSKENYVNFVDVNSSKTFYPELKTYLDSINDIFENESGFLRNANVPLKVECVECHTLNEIIVSVKFSIERSCEPPDATEGAERRATVTMEAVHGITEEGRDVSLRNCYLQFDEHIANHLGKP